MTGNHPETVFYLQLYLAELNDRDVVELADGVNGLDTTQSAMAYIADHVNPGSFFVDNNNLSIYLSQKGGPGAYEDFVSHILPKVSTDLDKAQAAVTLSEDAIRSLSMEQETAAAAMAGMAAEAFVHCSKSTASLNPAQDSQMFWISSARTGNTESSIMRACEHLLEPIPEEKRPDVIEASKAVTLEYLNALPARDAAPNPEN